MTPRLRIVTLAVAASLAHWFPSTARAQGATGGAAACAAVTGEPGWPRDSVPNLQGIWNFAVDMGASVSTGTMALGPMDDGYCGALTPDATNTVAIRKLTLSGDSVRMAVASREGDVLFDGRLIGHGDAMCGVVTYHGGNRFPMTATRRPSPNGRP